MADAAGKRKILIIDDDDDLAVALSALLTSSRYEVRRAADGAVGLEMAAAEPPDLILLDFMMPVKNGFEVCCELQENDRLRDVPVIALTAFGRDIGEVYGLAPEEAPSCVRDYLEKPYEANVLLERIASAIAGGS